MEQFRWKSPDISLSRVRGHGYGLFSYLKAYRFKLRSSYTLIAEAGKTTTVKIVAFEKGDFTTVV